MFLITGEELLLYLIDASPSIGNKIFKAISEVTK